MMKKLDTATLMRMAITGERPTLEQIVEAYGDEGNWKQVHENGRCYWAWVGPIIVGYELAKHWKKLP